MKLRLSSLFLAGSVASLMLGHGFADTIITLDGDELQGTIIKTTDKTVIYRPDGAPPDASAEIDRALVFMLKYDDGRKEVLAKKRHVESYERDNDRPYSIYLFSETGLFGLVNINEESFDPGVFTIGLTPSIDRRINRFLSIGVEYMILWVKANLADESRFIMNCNGLARVSFPLHRKVDFLAQLGAGLSLWPKGEGVHATDTTFFNDRIGWDIHGGLGLAYRISRRGAIVLFAGYNANFSTLNETPVTIDMLIVSLGPKFTF